LDRPILHEAFSFDIHDEHYILWKGSEINLSIEHFIWDQFLKFKLKDDSNSNIQFLLSDKMSGLNLNTDHLHLKIIDTIFFTTSLIEKLKAENYILNLSDIKTRNVKNVLQQKVSAFLKMSRKNVIDGKAVQGYGNIKIEITSFNDVLKYFSISCSYYQDQHFTDPLPFSRFIENIVCGK